MKNKAEWKINSIAFGLISVVSVLFVYFCSGSTTSVIPDYYGDDSAMFQVIGKAWRKGILPYVGVFDHKGPFIFLVDAIGWNIGKNGIMLLQILFMCVTFYGIYKIASLVTNDYLSIVLTMVSYVILIVSYGFGNYTEEYSLVFIVYSSYFAIKYIKNCDKEEEHFWGYAVWYGISFMCILLMRVTSAVAICCWILGIFVFLVIKKQWKNIIKNAIGFILGNVIAFAPFGMYFFVKGCFYEFIYGTLIHNVMYAGKSSIFAENVVWKPLIIAFMPVVLLLFSAIFYIIILKKKGVLLGITCILICCMSSVLFVKINPYLHYYIIVMPYFVIAFGMYWDCFKQLTKNILYRFSCFGLGALFVFSVVMSATRIQRQIFSTKVFINYAKDYKNSCKELMNEIPEQEKVDFLAFGSGALSQWYLLADVQPSYKYCMEQGWMSSCSDNIKGEILEYLNDKPAKWIVTDADYDTEEMLECYTPEYRQIITEKYELVKKSKMEKDHRCFLLYRKK